MKKSLYEINKTIETIWMDIEDIIENPDETGSDLDLYARAESALAGLEISLDEKLLNYARIIKNVKAEASSVKAEKDQLAARQKSLDKKVLWLTTSIKANVKQGDKIKDATCVISTRKSKRLELLCEVEDLPEGYVRTKIEADKARLKADALKVGEEFPYAKIIEDYSIAIK